MRLFSNTNFPFLRHRWVFISFSAVLVAASLFGILVSPKLALGVDFSGGTQLTLRFKTEPDLEAIRSTLEHLNLGQVSIQRFDEAELHEFLIRVQNPEQEGDYSQQMIEALDTAFNTEQSSLRLNMQGSDAIRDALVQADPDQVGGSVESRRAHYGPMADAILELRKEEGILAGPEDLQKIDVLSGPVRTYLSQHGRFGEFSLLAAENVGPLVGQDLRKKAQQAVGFSLIGMLVYIWFRFQLPYGIGALVAVFHDVIITLGALALTQREINLPTIAALLTLVGYSVNDTVVIFDRIRERLKLERGGPLADLMNRAINQTLSRTVMTSGTTLVVVLTLFIFGGDVINTFAFVLLIGILVGTYSSIYVASPAALGITHLLQKRKEAKRRSGRRR